MKHQRFLGAHVSSSGGFANAIRNGQALEINTIQIHASPPQRWNSKPYPVDFEKEFLELRKDSGVKRVFFHGIYLINLATPADQHFHLSKMSLVHYLDLMQRIKGDGVIFHVGSMKDQEDEATGYRRAADGINWIMENSPGESRLLLEVAAGGGKVIGDRIEELAEIYEMVENKERVGFALDSQHMWASGYDLQNDLEGVLTNIDSAVSFKKVWAIHLNDSKTELASRKDRHENLGQGLIGEKALRAFINHPKLVDIPFILETPALKAIETAKGECDVLREFAN